ncbi:MAG: hypothetical protein J07HQX50_00785 [Haloquadratum sp. J07HQX50]|nr:MAG: hypothetical protein J07HQX50_00785 [Haloquadratum sp. J07HQX50]
MPSRFPVTMRAFRSEASPTICRLILRSRRSIERLSLLLNVARDGLFFVCEVHEPLGKGVTIGVDFFFTDEWREHVSCHQHRKF